jgi:outer membrane protein assembly factor BamB
MLTQLQSIFLKLRSRLSLCLAAACLLLVSAIGCSAGKITEIDHKQLDVTGGLPVADTTSSTTIAPVNNSWPSLFGPTNNGRVPTPDLLSHWPDAGPPLRWERPIGTGYSSPIVVADRLIVMERLGDEERVACLESNTGEPIWEYRYPTTFECKAIYSSGPYSTPVSDGTSVFTIGAQGQLHCFELITGNVRWSIDLGKSFGIEQRIYAVGHSPAISDKYLYVNVGGIAENSGVVCFDKLTGDVVWKATSAEASYATPRLATIHGREFVFVLAYESAFALDATDGRVYWEIPFKVSLSDAENAITPLVDDDLVYFSSYGNGSLCIRINPDGSYEELWNSRQKLTSQFNSVVCIDGYLYGFHCSDNSLRCVHLQSGELVWRHKGKLRRSHLAANETHLFMLDEFGHFATARIDPKQCRMECISNSLFDDQYCFSAPAFASQLVYIRNETKLVCLDLHPPTHD